MHTTSMDRATRERPQSFRGGPRRPDQDLRDMLHDVIKDSSAPKGQRTPEHTGWRWHDLTREQPRTDVPSGDEDEMIAAAIRERCTMREQVVTYYLNRLARSLAVFPDHAEHPLFGVLYFHFAKENADAVHWQALARAVPTPENRARAILETRELLPIAELACAELERNTFPLPMGATPR